MTLTETLNDATGKRRYYLDGKRIPRTKAVTLKDGHDQDSFLTTMRDGIIRHQSCLRKRS